jgi:hypothetical protein
MASILTLVEYSFLNVSVCMFVDLWLLFSMSMFINGAFLVFTRPIVTANVIVVITIVFRFFFPTTAATTAAKTTVFIF